MTLFRVEWDAADDTVATYHYHSHDMTETDARAMASTIRPGASNVAVIPSAVA